MKNLTQIEGTVENIIYYNEENSYTVFSIKINQNEDNEIICTGYVPKLDEGESIMVTGSYVVHPTYGKQLNVERFEKKMPTIASNIEKYLSSGVIKGIGERLAKRIVAKFGDSTLEIMEHYPDKLSQIKGITFEKAQSISSIFHEQAELRQVMIFLQDYGITPAYALKIFKRYKENTVDMVKKNPYALADDIFGIGFKTADSIAYRIGIEQDSPHRIRAGIRYVLNEAMSDGHSFLPKDELEVNTSQLLGISVELIDNELLKLQLERLVWQERINEKYSVYLNNVYHAENYIAKKLLDLSDNVLDKSKNIAEEISLTENRLNISLADNQKKAVIEAVRSGVLIITGGPGTGKTTTINAIISILKKISGEIELAAPTGRAAKRMSDTTGMSAKTIHRLLGISFMSDDSRRQSFDKDEDNTIEADVIIIDESSMVDVMLMHSLLKAIAPGTRLILVGDVDQLPSVGPGNVLKDIINSGCVNVVRLTEIFRQAQESAIVMNAHRINKGEYPLLNEKEKDFFFIKKYQPDDILSSVLELVMKRLPQYVGCDLIQDIQVLTPTRKSTLGVASLNNMLQSCLNPPSPNKMEKEFRSAVFRNGDKVMHIKNNYNLMWRIKDAKGKVKEEGLGVFNGDCGIITEIDDESESITVLFDDSKIVVYDYTQLEELELAYAITIHKSQGSEYKVVVIPLYNGPPMLMSRNLLYTAVTRAKELVVIVGVPEVLYRMVNNNREVNRYSALDMRLIKMNGYLKNTESFKIIEKPDA